MAEPSKKRNSTTGQSRIEIDKYIRRPSPGMLKISSMINDPEINAGKIPANHAIIGINAAGNASYNNA